MKTHKIKSRAEAVLSGNDKDILVSLGIGIRAHRVAAGWTRLYMADRLVIGVQTLARMEKGDPRISLGYYLAACRLVGLQLIDPFDLTRQSEHLNLARIRARGKSDDESRFL